MRKILLFCLIPALFFSCKKETDLTPPTITVLSPTDGSHANVYDTLDVHFTLNDNLELKHYQVDFVNAQMEPVLSTVAQNISGKSYEVQFDYVIDNIHLPDGIYYVQIRAMDNNNNTRYSYTSVYLTALPLRCNGFFAATVPSSNHVSLYKCDTSWAAVLTSQFSTDFTDLIVNSYWQQVYINGKFTGPLRAIGIDGTTTLWTLPSLVSVQPYWGPMSVNSSSLWVSFAGDGRLKNLKQDGTTLNAFSADNGYLLKQQLQVGNRVFSEQKDISSSNVKMVVYTTAGSGLQETMLNLDVTGMFAKDNDNIYVAGNSAGQGHLLIYDYNANGCWEPIALPAGTVTSATQVDSQTLLIGMSNGTVYKFTYNPVGLLTWMSGVNISQLQYNAADSTVFSAEGMQVKEYDFASAAFLHGATLPDSVRDFELWFNR